MKSIVRIVVMILLAAAARAQPNEYGEYAVLQRVSATSKHPDILLLQHENARIHVRCEYAVVVKSDGLGQDPHHCFLPVGQTVTMNRMGNFLFINFKGTQMEFLIVDETVAGKR